MHFEKEHMKGAHYEWHADNFKDIFNGEPSRRAFDKFNGEQMLFLINFYCSVMDNFNISECRRIESEILNHLPLDVRSEISVFNWMKDQRITEKHPVD